jgi:uncharacterized protein (UPF0333 family)
MAAFYKHRGEKDNNMHMKGLSSIEYLFVTGLGIAALALVIVIIMNTGNDSMRLAQAKEAVDALAKSADYVYSLGPCSQETVGVYLPQGIRSINASGNTIRMTVALSAGDSDVYAKTNGMLNGTIRGEQGAQKVTITSTQNKTWNGVTLGNASADCG